MKWTIGKGISPFIGNRGGISWSSYWTTLISATVENAAPTHVVLTFPIAKPALGATDFTIAGFTVSSASWAGAVLTLVLAETVYYGDSLTVTFVPTGGTYTVTNNSKQIIRKTDIVIAGGYLPLTSNLAFSINGRRTLLNKNNVSRIRQNGNITKVQFYKADDTVFNPICIDFWRKDGATYDRIGRADVTALITMAIGAKDVTLASPIAVLEGDFVAINGYTGDATDVSISGTSGMLANSLRYNSDNLDPSTPDYNWDIKTAAAYTIPIKCFLQAPILVGIGDSIIMGANANYSFISDSLTHDITSQITYQLSLLDAKYVCQNMGYVSQTSTDIEARFDADVVALKPKFALILIGINDIILAMTKVNYMAKMTSILDKCESNGIIPVIIKILPCTDRSNAEMQTRDDWMTTLQTLVTTYSGSVWVDCDSAIGKNRVGGDLGNYWDIQTTPDYDDDGIHLTVLGYAKIAEVVDVAIKPQYTLV